MTIVLRDYQVDCIDAIAREFVEKQSTLIVLPTGCGKTSVFAEQIRRSVAAGAKSVMVIAHREELLEQAAARITRQAGLPCDIEMADRRAGHGWARAPVVCASIQTLSMGGMRRAERFSPDLVVVDEAHHAVAKSYRNVIGLYAARPDCKVLGVTATPDRADELALGQIFESVAFDMHIADAIEQGWLVRIRQSFVQCRDLDLSGVKTVAGDLNQSQLGEVLDRDSVVAGMVDGTLRRTEGLRTLVFAANVDQATKVRDAINERKPGSAAVVSGTTPSDERKSIFRAFGEGRIQYLTNCAIATEGWDDPALDGKGVQCIAMMRPTKSRALYAQAIGRGTRSLPGVLDGLTTAGERVTAIGLSAKPAVKVLDFVGNAGRHLLVHAGDILGGRVCEEAQARVGAKGKRGSDDDFDVLAELEGAEREIAIEKARKAEERKRQREARVMAAVRANDTEHEVDPFRFTGITPRAVPGWFRGKTATDAQRNLLKKYRCPVPADLNIGQAKQLLDELTKKPTPGQCWVLRQHRLDPERYDFRSAMAAIDQAKRGTANAI